MESADRDARHLQNGLGETALTPSEAAVQVVDSKPQGGEQGPSNVNCYRCGGKHLAKLCKFKGALCYNCGKRGHISRVCRSQSAAKKGGTFRPQRRKVANTVTATGVVGSKEEEAETYTMFQLRSDKNEPLYVTVQVAGVPVQMEIDTGATVSVISKATYQAAWEGRQAPTLQRTAVKLRTYTGQEIPVVGATRGLVEHGQEQKELPLIVTKGQGPSLLGRNWLEILKLDWKAIHRVRELDSLAAILSKHSVVFRRELGLIQGTTAKVEVDPQGKPVFYRPRPVPFSLRRKVEEELERLETEGIIRPRQFSSWAAPIVPVVKADGTVRICGDYRTTVNRVMKVDSHPIPRMEDLFNAMSGGLSFSKLDLSHAYLQLQVDESSRDYLVINTHKGLFEYTRMPFGVASAPSVFQRTMDNLLQGLEHVAVYLDDILVTGRTQEDHLRTLE